MKILKITLLSFILLFSLGSCNQAKKAGGDSGAEKSRTSATYAYQTLADYLRRDPKVRVSGSGDNLVVYIRSADTISGNFEPLFVIDGNVYATSYSEASRLVQVENVKSVRVLNATEGSAQYGMRGNNGVVIIKTKGTN
jgi:hypothetical protein